MSKTGVSSKLAKEFFADHLRYAKKVDASKNGRIESDTPNGQYLFTISHNVENLANKIAGVLFPAIRPTLLEMFDEYKGGGFSPQSPISAFTHRNDNTEFKCVTLRRESGEHLAFCLFEENDRDARFHITVFLWKDAPSQELLARKNSLPDIPTTSDDIAQWRDVISEMSLCGFSHKGVYGEQSYYDLMANLNQIGKNSYPKNMVMNSGYWEMKIDELTIINEVEYFRNDLLSINDILQLIPRKESASHSTYKPLLDEDLMEVFASLAALMFQENAYQDKIGEMIDWCEKLSLNRGQYLRYNDGDIWVYGEKTPNFDVYHQLNIDAIEGLGYAIVLRKGEDGQYTSLEIYPTSRLMVSDLDYMEYSIQGMADPMDNYLDGETLLSEINKSSRQRYYDDIELLQRLEGGEDIQPALTYDIATMSVKISRDFPKLDIRSYLDIFVKYDYKKLQSLQSPDPKKIEYDSIAKVPEENRLLTELGITEEEILPLKDFLLERNSLQAPCP